MASETKFKETEIGMIPEDWDIKALNDVSTITDSLHKTPEYTKDGFPMVRVTDLTEGFLDLTNALKVDPEVYEEFTRRYKPKKSDIIISRVGSYGIPSYVNSNSNFCLGQNTASISPKIDSLYLFYCLRSGIVKKQIEYLAVGSTQKTLSLKNIQNLLVPICDVSMQKKIADFLYSLDQKINLNRQNNFTLEQIAQTLFKHWFIDFEFPDENGNPYKSSGGRMVDSELGKIPEGWKVGSILDFADLLSGGTPKTSVSEYWNGEINWVSAKDVTNSNGTFILTTEKTITQKGIEKSNTKLLPKFTTVVTARGTVGKYCILSKEMAINQTNYGLKSKFDYGDFFLFFTTLNLIQDMKQNAYGTVFDTITTKTFSEIQTILPSTSVVKSFENIIYSLMYKILSNLEESQNLSSIRDSLLPKLMSGKIRVEC